MLPSLVLLLSLLSTGWTLQINLTSNGPVVVGATITFRAQIFEDNGQQPRGSYQYKWRDDAIPTHWHTDEGEKTVSYWNVTYPRDTYPPGPYRVQVEVSKKTLYIYWNWNIYSKRLDFELTPILNGNMNITQRNKTITNNYVSTASEVVHSVHLNDPDQAYLTKNATSVVTYWFVNCIYFGATSDQTFKYNYTGAADQDRLVEALVVASFDPLPPPSTTVAPTTTTTHAPVPPNSTTTTDKPSTTTPKSSPTILKLSNTTMTPNVTTSPSNNITALVKPYLKVGTNFSTNPVLPFVCIANSIIPPDPNKTYGYFSESVEVKAPVSNVVVSPTNWIKHGEILNLSVTCNGSSPFMYCFLIIDGTYNITGNESCTNVLHIISGDCQMNLHRYIHRPGQYTILIIISNEVSNKVTPHGLYIYEVKKRPQLSVIVVPVTCCAVAVVLMVFGAAYYMQGRHRYTVEVADFDFGQTSDLEYMTFGQRLRDAVNSAFARSHESDYHRLSNGSSTEPRPRY